MRLFHSFLFLHFEKDVRDEYGEVHEGLQVYDSLMSEIIVINSSGLIKA